MKTAEDFGAQGEWPSHPDLLDYLAVSFIESRWDVKALIKQIVMSETYSSRRRRTPERFPSDPQNRLLSRGSRFRLDSEVIRDQVLATSGLLNCRIVWQECQAATAGGSVGNGQHAQFVSPHVSNPTRATRSIGAVSTPSGSEACRRHR